MRQGEAGAREAAHAEVTRARAGMVMRVRGLRSRQRRMTSASAALRSGGTSIACAGSVIACIFWMKASAAKGVWPVTIWYRMQPRLHTSDGRPTWRAAQGGAAA